MPSGRRRSAAAHSPNSGGGASCTESCILGRKASRGRRRVCRGSKRWRPWRHAHVCARRFSDVRRRSLRPRRRIRTGRRPFSRPPTPRSPSGSRRRFARARGRSPCSCSMRAARGGGTQSCRENRGDRLRARCDWQRGVSSGESGFVPSRGASSGGGRSRGVVRFASALRSLLLRRCEERRLEHGLRHSRHGGLTVSCGRHGQLFSGKRTVGAKRHYCRRAGAQPVRRDFADSQASSHRFDSCEAFRREAGVWRSSRPA